MVNLGLGVSLEIAGSFGKLIEKSAIYTLSKPQFPDTSRDNKSMCLGIPLLMPEIRIRNGLRIINPGFWRENGIPKPALLF